MGQALTEIKLPDKKSKKNTGGEQTQTSSIVSIPEETSPVENETNPFVIEFNTAMLADFKEEGERSDMQNKADNQRFFSMEDASKFDDL